MQTLPRKHTRCFVCRQYVDSHDVHVKTWSRALGWHTGWRLCRICWRVLAETAIEAARDYQ